MCFLRLSDAKCLRFRLPLLFGLRCERPRCQIASDVGRAMRTTKGTGERPGQKLTGLKLCWNQVILDRLVTLCLWNVTWAFQTGTQSIESQAHPNPSPTSPTPSPSPSLPHPLANPSPAAVEPPFPTPPPLRPKRNYKQDV